MSPDFGGCAMTAHPRQPVFILPEKVSASGDTTDASPDMAARHHDTNNNNRNGILSLLLSVIMLVKPSLLSAQASQPQGPVNEPQKIEQSIGNKNELNKQLLRHASSSGIEFMKTLYINNALSKGADVNAADEYGLTSLHYAAKHGNKDIITLLLTKGAIVDSKDNTNRTPLHYAAGAAAPFHPQGWSTDIAKMLLEKGASINIQDKRGWTPLHYVTFELCHIPTVEFFIDRGADINCSDNRGFTPYSFLVDRISYYGLKVDIHGVSDYVNEFKEMVKFLQNNYGIDGAVDKESNQSESDKLHIEAIETAIDNAHAGDTIIVRGGTYSCSHTIRIDNSGESGKPINLIAFPGEVPVFDFSGASGDTFFISGSYWRFKGIVIIKGDRGIVLYGSGARHNILEQMSTYDNELLGIHLMEGANHNIVLNCDTYRNFDRLRNGEDSDGIGVANNIGQGNVIIGSRAWNNSDDGFDLWQAGKSVRIERCYAFRNGENIWNHPFFSGNGSGFKLGGGEGRHVLIGCLAWGHSLSGATLNNNASGVILRNCTFWDNDTNYFFEWSGWQEEAKKNCVFINNISYKGHARDKINPGANSQFNSWDAGLGLTLTGDDFASLDDSMMTKPRNPDGSIPQNDFLRLSPQSAAIDKGVDVGMPFAGERPDLGAFEHDPNKPSQGYVKMLHQYVRDRDIKKIKELLAQGEGINDKDWLGYTPIQWAVYFGYPDVVELLLSKGADPDIQSDTGRFALEIAKAMVYADIEALLRKHGAKQ